MEDLLIKLAEKVYEENPLENKKWIEIGFNYNEFYPNGIEWRASLIYGQSLDCILSQHNFFADNPMEALKKLDEHLKQSLS